MIMPPNHALQATVLALRARPARPHLTIHSRGTLLLAIFKQASGGRPLNSGVRPLIAGLDLRHAEFVATGKCHTCSLASFAAL